MQIISKYKKRDSEESLLTHWAICGVSSGYVLFVDVTLLWPFAKLHYPVSPKFVLSYFLPWSSKGVVYANFSLRRIYETN